jgi:hypothetical protein
VSKQRDCANRQGDAARHDTILRIAVKRKHSIRKVYEAKRGSATVHGLAECKKQHTAHIKELHKERCGWEVGEWRRVSLVLAAWCTGGSGQGERGGAQGWGTILLKAVFEGREYEGERCGARFGRVMREKCEVTLEVDESMPNGTQGERYGSDG